MIVLGLSFSHDASFSLVDNGEIKFLVATERLTRVKKDTHIYLEHIEDTLYQYGYNLNDVDYITFSFFDGENDWLKVYSENGDFRYYDYRDENSNVLDNREYVEGLGYRLGSQKDTHYPISMDKSSDDKYYLKGVIRGYDKVFDVVMTSHQIAHAASAFFTSPYQRAGVFTVDASMHYHQTCSGFFIGDGLDLQLYRYSGYMFGNVYDVGTEFCGLGPGTLKAGSMMGLSAYGLPNEVAKTKWEELTKPQWEYDGSFTVWTDYIFSRLSGKFPFLGSLRKEIENNEPGSEYFNREVQTVFSKEESDSEEVMNIAASLQHTLEESLIKYTQEFYNESIGLHDGNICYAGGTMLNCNANNKLRTRTDFDNHWWFPACGDDGTSLGSALFVTHTIARIPRLKYDYKDLMYLGNEYDSVSVDGEDLNLKDLAKDISEGKIICWYQGRSEAGPRALGNRSFLTDPRNPEMKDILNSRVKFREWYRPFAPVIMEEHTEEWFELDVPSPFMLLTVPCKKPKEIPSAVHVDNSARVQTVNSETNSKLYYLLKEFRDLTGVPVLLNTSLNVKGEPIVETVEDAIRLFNESDVDVLVIDNKVIRK